jgi:hypothetical protein
VYKIIFKLISQRLKTILLTRISPNQFGFLNGRQIHKAIGMVQEGLQSIKSGNQKSLTLKVDLSEEFDRVSWLYLMLLLTHLGLFHAFMTWTLSCINVASFDVLVNGSTSFFFKDERGIRQGCPLYPFLFLLVVEGLIKLLKEAYVSRIIEGINLGISCNITHLLVVVDVLILCDGTRELVDYLNELLNLFNKATCMKINREKSSLVTWGLSYLESNTIS